MFVVRTVEIVVGEKKVKTQKIFVEKRKNPKDKFKIKTCPKNQIVEPWKKYQVNQYRAVDGKKFATKKEMQTYNKMYTPKVNI